MHQPRRAPDDHHPDATPAGVQYDPYGGPPHAGPDHSFDAGRRDSYVIWFVVGLVSPFLLAVPLYPLVWLPVSAVALPVAAALWAVISAIIGLFAPANAADRTAPGGPANPAFWDFGPLLSPQVALTSAVAVTVAWYVLSRVVGKRRYWHPEGAAKRGFRASLRVALLAAFLLAVWWANRTLAAS